MIHCQLDGGGGNRVSSLRLLGSTYYSSTFYTPSYLNHWLLLSRINNWRLLLKYIHTSVTLCYTRYTTVKLQNTETTLVSSCTFEASSSSLSCYAAAHSYSSYPCSKYDVCTSSFSRRRTMPSHIQPQPPIHPSLATSNYSYYSVLYADYLQHTSKSSPHRKTNAPHVFVPPPLPYSLSCMISA